MTRPPTGNWQPATGNPRSGFTLIELLVSIGILALLIGLTVKGVSKFRQAAWVTDTNNQLMTIQNGIQAYYSTFHAYPGPLPNRWVGAALVADPYFPVSATDSPAQWDLGGTNLVGITGTENLVLGLFGGLKYDNLGGPPWINYKPELVGQGPLSLNQAAPKKYGSFLEDQRMLSWRTVNNKKTGKYEDDAGKANDTVIPEIVDRFPQGMPILYLRADSGAAWSTSLTPTPTAEINNIISKDTDDNPATHVAQFHLKHIKAYTATGIGESKKAVNGNLTHGLRDVTVSDNALSGPGPYDAYPYFVNQSLSTPEIAGKPGSGHTARKKDEYILISAGADRIYGTHDDITNFGQVSGD